jgi:threonine dehydrogenase-like Zn-dependent dehydrogenase
MSRHTKQSRPCGTDVWIYRGKLIERNPVSGMYSAFCGRIVQADTRNGIRETVRGWREMCEGKTTG